VREHSLLATLTLALSQGERGHALLPLGEGRGVREHSLLATLTLALSPWEREHSLLPLGEGRGVRVV